MKAEKVDVEEILYPALENLKKLDLLYLEGENDEKRKIIGSIFPEKWTYDGIGHRTGKENLGMQLIYLLNNKLGHKKTGVKTSKCNYSGPVSRTVSVFFALKLFNNLKSLLSS
ncbi:hypothetical protein [Pedobacter sp.]|uniref:hypothetical protein n=1 Tax=Pedobacter sp. TaxID=1411316 RepID=UPI003BA981D0